MNPPADGVDDEEREMIAALWVGARDRVLDRLGHIEAAVAELASGALTGPVQEEGVADAHRLAGSLGSFGLPEGTRLARELERLLGASPDTESAPVAAQLVADLRVAIESGP